MQPSEELTKALALINFSDRKATVPRPLEQRRGYATKVAAAMLPETAEAVYGELLRRLVLFKDEADLLESLSERLDKPLTWRSMALRVGGQWREGRYADNS